MMKQTKRTLKHNKYPLQVGITGGIGAGKSMICRAFSALDIPVYDADSRGKWLLVNDVVLKQAVIQQFGKESYLADGTPNRQFLGKKVFNDEEALKLLNGLVHPRVALDYGSWVNEHQLYPYLVKEAALLFESGSYQQLDLIINVSAPVEERLKRVLSRDVHRTEADVKAIMAKQWTDVDREAQSDKVLYNDGSTMLLPIILAFHESMIQKRRNVDFDL